MGLKSRLAVENIGMFAVSVFYAVIGVVCFAVLATDFRMIHIGLIGILSLVTAYGLFKRRMWALWSAFVLFFMATVFAISMLYYTMGSNFFVDVIMAAYLILTWIFTVYIATRRKKLEF
ncbi:MAG: hypothetical protein QXH37_08795 [Candidatus Bathyarchaeia archaeon]